MELSVRHPLSFVCLSVILAACSTSGLDSSPGSGSLPTDGGPEGAARSVAEASTVLDASFDGGSPDATLDGAFVDTGPDGAVDGTAPGDATTGAPADAIPDAPSDATPDAPSDAASDATGAIVHDAVYIASFRGGIIALALDPVTAVPTPIPESPFDVDAAFDNIALDPTGTRIYAGDDHAFIHGFAVGAGGALVPLPGSPYPTAGSALSLAVDPLGRFLYVGNATVDTIAVLVIGDDGSLAPVGVPVMLPVVPTFLAADP